MTDLAWMKTYIGTETAVTSHLTAEEFGAYERLRRHFWQHGGLPEDDDRLARITGLSLLRWQELASAIVPLIASALPNLSQERSSSVNKRLQKINAGKKGADVRWQKDGTTIENGRTNANANGKDMANAMAEAMDNQWPSASASYEERYEERLSPTHVHTREESAPDEYPFDPPESEEQGRTFLINKGLQGEQVESCLPKLMAYRLYPADISNVQRGAA